MNIICFPTGKMDISVLQEILRGGLDKIKEAGALLVGGHSVEDDELKYGLSVTGVIHPDMVLKHRGAKPGDSLILTKPIGTGIINTAIKGNLVDPGLIETVTEIMATLNNIASHQMKNYEVSACTDVTGFGLLGHACEMIDDGSVGLKLNWDKVPLIDQTLDFARMGIVPAGAHRNRENRKDMIRGLEDIGPVLSDILFDPQTSGGLLIALNDMDAGDLVDSLRFRGLIDVEIIGRFTDENRGEILL
jgi:selenide,water dikinase